MVAININIPVVKESMLMVIVNGKSSGGLETAA